ncbi:uncharacterized protein LOC122392128 isoform X2 [Amphibalanus amphitrite]|uniref:uncharacterized protein LOC122392128 isoform X2 n=1 Tax=Amphibalanus amphitrite TaxID=1232801 RepID=UPI001C91198C|nr:uncharacterized protein LOC122392128 isoform X2 [Amphibalanus amphitrite]XP_043242628.1 uncharacterized protein LOC122392128 isoform X2 [Amphibalanus amphitrite]XP_043242629.1 uncharacterized protein LOC122392128 isoform X2 [Amphibalanus amphitrite]
MVRTALLVLLAVAAASAQYDLPGGYLPPQCPPAPAPVTKTEVQYVTRTVVKPVVRPEVRYTTKQVVSSRVVPSEIVSTVVTQQPTYVYRTAVVTKTELRYSTSVVQIPGQKRVVQNTLTKPVNKEVVTDVYRTVYTTLVQPTTLVKTSIVTKVNVESKYVPKYMQAVTTVVVPGPTVYLTKTKQVVRTSVEPRQQPAVYRTKYVTAYTSVYRTVPVPGPTETYVRTVYQTKPVVRTEVRYSTQVLTKTVQQRVPVEVTVTSTQYTTQVVPRVIYSTKYVPQYYTKTQIVDVPRVVTVTNIRTISSRVPAYPVYRTKYSTGVQYSTVPGQVRQQVQYKTVTDYTTIYSTATRVVPQYTTKTETVKKPCGYSYPEPSNPLRF